MNRRLVLLLAVLAAPMAAQSPAEPSESFRMDYRLVRTTGGESGECRFSALVASPHQSRITENVSRPLPGSGNRVQLGVALRTDLHQADPGRIELSVFVDITEMTPVRADGGEPGLVQVTGNTRAVVPLTESVSLISLETQEGDRKYELFVTATRVED